jgi:hypothetical protein
MGRRAKVTLMVRGKVKKAERNSKWTLMRHTLKVKETIYNDYPTITFCISLYY